MEAAVTINDTGHSCKPPLMLTPCDSCQRTEDHVKGGAKLCEERRLAQVEDPSFQDEANRSQADKSVVQSVHNPCFKTENTIQPAANTNLHDTIEKALFQKLDKFPNIS